VNTNDEVRLGESCEQTIVQHRGGAAAAFFRGLTDQHQRAVPPIAVRRHPGGGARPRRHVQVVSARVHHGNGLSRRVAARCRARERDARLLGDRQGIELGPQHRGWPGAVSQQRDDAGLADAGGHVEAERLEAIGEQCGRSRFLKTQLRMLVKIPVQRLELASRRRDVRVRRLRGRRDRGYD
jgi:hypothetical protein